MRMNFEDLVQYEIWCSELSSALEMKHQYLENERMETDEKMKEVYREVAFYYEGNCDNLLSNIEMLKARKQK